MLRIESYYVSRVFGEAYRYVKIEGRSLWECHYYEVNPSDIERISFQFHRLKPALL
jgi:hypothetical protein